MSESLRSTDFAIDTALAVVDESQINRFRIYLRDELRTCMHYRQEFYGLIYEVAAKDRLAAYQLGYDLLVEGLPILMTASKQRYALWLDLRRASASHYELLK